MASTTCDLPALQSAWPLEPNERRLAVKRGSFDFKVCFLCFYCMAWLVVAFKTQIKTGWSAVTTPACTEDPNEWPPLKIYCCQFIQTERPND
jgi:hypothetical protein